MVLRVGTRHLGRSVGGEAWPTSAQGPWNSARPGPVLTASHINGTFYFLCSILDGCSRFIVHWEIREKMEKIDVETIIQRSREMFPGTTPRIINDNGPQFIAKDRNHGHGDFPSHPRNARSPRDPRAPLRGTALPDCRAQR